MIRLTQLITLGLFMVMATSPVWAQSIYDAPPVDSGIRLGEPAPPRELPLAFREDRQPQALVENQARAVSFDETKVEPLVLRRTPDDQLDAVKRSPLVTVLSALSIVLGLYFGFVWLARRAQVSTEEPSRELPSQVVNVLGTFRLSSHHEAHVVRFGSKLLALAVTPEGCQPIAEINDPEEVEYLTKVCRFGPRVSMPARISDLLEDEHYDSHDAAYRRH